MTITFYLLDTRKHNLYCRIGNGNDRSVISLKYAVDSKKWNDKEQSLPEGDPHYYTLEGLKYHLNKIISNPTFKSEEDAVSYIKNHLAQMIQQGGMDGIDAFLFNEERPTGMPTFNNFEMALENATSIKSNSCRVEINKYRVHFHSKNDTYTVETPIGTSQELFDIMNGDYYDDLLHESDFRIWDEVFKGMSLKENSAKFAKYDFMAEMNNQLNKYWGHYDDIYGGTEKNSEAKIKEYKENSRYEFNIFRDCYDTCEHPVIFSRKLSEELCTICILTFFEFYGVDECINSYTETNFNSSDYNKNRYQKVIINKHLFYVSKDI